MMFLRRSLWFLGRVLFGLIIGAFLGLAISDYIIRTNPEYAMAVTGLDEPRDSP